MQPSDRPPCEFLDRFSTAIGSLIGCSLLSRQDSDMDLSQATLIAEEIHGMLRVPISREEE